MTDLLNVELNLVESGEDYDEFRRWLGGRRPILAVDVETTGLEWYREKTRLVQFGDAESGWAFPADDWRGAIREALTEYEGPITGHNTRFDLHFLKEFCGFETPWKRTHDTMIQAALLDPPGRKGLKYLAVKHIDPFAAAGQDELQEVMTKNRWGWADVPVNHPAYWSYAVLDTILTARLWEKFDGLIHRAGLADAYELECNTARVLFAMERHGFALDTAYVEDLRTQLNEFVEHGTLWVFDNYGIKVSSNKELARTLASIGAPLTKETASGNIAVDEEVLGGLSEKYELAKVALEVRKAMKISGAYLSNFLKYQAPDGMIHAQIRQMQARTHRMSITAPALQTLGRGKLVRNAFVARPGNKLISCDFAQVEARIFAHYSNEETLIGMITEGHDPYTAAALVGLGRQPTKIERQMYKTVVLGIGYGAGVEKIAITTGMTFAAADIFVRAYHETFPGVKRWMKEVEALGRERELAEGVAYVRTSDGSILSLSPGEDRYYALTNFTIQGDAAVLFKRRMISVANAGLLDYMVLPVHDEIIIETTTAMAEEARVTLADAMQDLYSYRVPITAEAGPPVDRWGEAKT